MYLQNVRFGFACNSSSLHSIVVFDKKIPDYVRDEDAAHGYYDRGAFVLATTDAKKGWIDALLKYAVATQQIPKYIRDWYDQEWGGVPLPEDTYVDHQSRIPLPCYPGSQFINKEFYDELKKHLLADHVVIFGGSDEEPDKRVTYERVMADRKAHAKESHVGVLQDKCFEYARRDPEYGYWVLFNKIDGTKLRFSFDDQPITCASIPELVDVKITDYCTRECSYCYQNSGTKGKHADFSEVRMIVDALAEMGVLEIAWNGGEPTKYPRFLDLLEYTHRKGITSNFTTRNSDWFRDVQNANAFNKYCGRVAFSFETANDQREAEAVATFLQFDRDKRVVMQYIDGVGGWDANSLSYLPVTLLGYKETGRGAHPAYFIRENHIPFKAIMKKLWSVGIDTKYAQDYEKELRAAVSEESYEKLVTAYDGLYSMYIDAVTMTMGPYSYCKKEQLVPIKQRGIRLDALSFRSPYTATIQEYFRGISKKTAEDKSAKNLTQKS